MFAPVSVFINRNIPVARAENVRLEAVERSLREANVFSWIGSNVDSEYYLDIKLRGQDKNNAAIDAENIVNAATLALLPVHNHYTNLLVVDVYRHGQKIKTYKYQGDYDVVMTAFNNRLQGDAFVSIHNLVNEFVRDIDRDNLLPRIGKKQEQGSAVSTGSGI